MVSRLLTKFVTGGSNWPAEQQLDDVQEADVGGPDEGSVAVVVLFQQNVDVQNENNYLLQTARLTSTRGQFRSNSTAARSLACTCINAGPWKENCMNRWKSFYLYGKIRRHIHLAKENFSCYLLFTISILLFPFHWPRIWQKWIHVCRDGWGCSPGCEGTPVAWPVSCPGRRSVGKEKTTFISKSPVCFNR